MKHLKMMGLAVVAALAVMAMVGAGTASAEGTACSTNTSACGSLVAPGTKISASLATGHASLTTSVGTVTCKKSTVAGTINEPGKAHGEITGLTFTECSIGSTTCSAVKSENTPYTVTGVPTGSGNGDLTVTPKTLNPGAIVECGTVINCTFSSKHVNLKFTGGTGGVLPTVMAENVSLERSGGLCPSTATWNAHYQINTPTSLFITV
jgi:hypothetical protein